MQNQIEVGDKYADLIESAEKVRGGQTRKYGPYEEVYDIHIKTADPDEAEKKKILEFCQECCHRCGFSAGELNKVQCDRSIPFEKMMKAVVEGSYTIGFYPEEKLARYTWSQDYLD